MKKAQLYKASGQIDRIKIVEELEKLGPLRQWSNEEGFIYDNHFHEYEKVLYCLEGSIDFTFPASGEKIHMEVGDKIVVPPFIKHRAIAGPEGVVAIEAAISTEPK